MILAIAPEADDLGEIPWDCRRPVDTCVALPVVVFRENLRRPFTSLTLTPFAVSFQWSCFG